METQNRLKRLFVFTPFLLVFIIIIILFSLMGTSTVLAQSGNAFVRLVRTFELEEANLSNPAGLAYTPWSNAFQVVEGRRPGQPLPAETEIVTLTPYNDRAGSARVAAAIRDPINVAVDSYYGRLLIFNSAAKQLIEVPISPDGTLQSDKLTRHSGGHFGLQNAQGMTVDPASGTLFVLDQAELQMVRIAPAADGSFDAAEISKVDLGSSGLVNPVGLAFDPRSGHHYVVDQADQRLYELSQSGLVLATRDLSAFGIVDPQGMVFAPSGDLTDSPEQMHLYLADSGSTDSGSSGQILELSFVEIEPAAEPNYTSSLIQTIEAWLWSPPSPDSAGVVYLPDSDELLVTDSEVNEMPIYEGVNTFQATLTGTLTISSTTISYSDEPTGVTLKPANKHLFISDDTDERRIFEVDPGLDGLYNTGDDTVTSILTSDFGSNDPEGVTYDPSEALFIADGLNNEIYKVTPGLNGIFDGVPPQGDDEWVSFDTAILGLFDPEGIAFNPDSGHLYVIGEPTDTLFEVTTLGALVQTIDVSAANAFKPAGLAYAPDSDTISSNWNIYIADRGVDNNSDANENDGRVYEMTLPVPPSGNVAPSATDDSDSTSINVPVTINVSVNDADVNGNLDPTTANTTCTYGSTGCASPVNGNLQNHNDGTFTYTPNTDFTGNDLFVYEICDEGGLCDTATVSIAVFGQQTIYLSSISGGRVGGVFFSDEDILAYSTVTGSWSMFFDGSDVGLDAEGADIDAFHINPDGSLLLSMTEPGIIGGITFEEWDILRFIPTSTGEVTAGSFELYFDGEDVGLEGEPTGLNNIDENIDSFSFAPDGRLVIGTRGRHSVGGITAGDDEDLLIFTATSLGETTSGTWEVYFDGSDVLLDDSNSEDVSGTWIDANGDIYLSTRGEFSVPGTGGDGADIFTCVPSSIGDTTTCTFSMYWDGLAHGFEGHVANAIFIHGADMSVAKVDAVDPVIVGATVSYTVTVENNGPYPALSVAIIDTLPASVDFVSATPDQGACGHTTGVVTCDLLDIADGASVDVIIDVTTTELGVITNTVSVSSDSSDHYGSNNITSEDTTVSPLPTADLSVVKVDAVDPVLVGDTVTYTATVSNAGPDLAVNTALTDTLPASVNFVSATPDQGTCDYAAGVVTCDLLEVANGASIDVTISVTTTVQGLLTNNVSVSSDTYDPNGLNNSADEETTVEPTADLSVAKVDAVDPVLVSDLVTYTVTVSNAGPDPAMNAVLTDTLPSSVDFVSATPDQGTCDYAAGLVTCDLLNVASGASLDVTIIVTTNTQGVITNNASVSSDTGDPDESNNSASEETTVDPTADLSVAKVDAVDPVLVGDPVTYTVSVSNAGPDRALNVAITDTLPASVDFVSATPDQGTCDQAAGVVTCDLLDLASGASVEVTIVVTTTEQGSLTNNVIVSSDTGDPDGSNNSASENTIVGETADLSVAKVDAVDPVFVGDPINYTVTVSNAGPDPATNVELVDTLPASVDFVSATPDQGTCEHVAGVVTCDLLDLASGASVEVTIVVTATEQGLITNTASVSADTGDPDESNNSASEETTVEPIPTADLSVTKIDAVDPVFVGDLINYTVTVSNAGPDSATNVELVDTLPASVDFVSATPDQGTCDYAAKVVTCDLLNIASGDSVDVIIIVTTTTQGVVTNSASVSSDITDPDGSNNSASEDTMVSYYDIHLPVIFRP